MDRRVREQPVGHLGRAALGGPLGIGVEIDLEAVRRAQLLELELEAFERAFRGLGLGVEHARLEADGHDRGVGGHTWMGAVMLKSSFYSSR